MAKPEQKGRWKRVALMMLLLLLAFGAYRWIRTDPKVRKVRDIQKELAAAEPAARAEKMGQLREAMDKLNPQQRDAMRKELSDDRRRREEEEMKRYAQLSATDKESYLDRQIERMQNRRNRQNEQNASGTSLGPNGAFGAPNGGGQGGASRGNSGGGNTGPDGGRVAPSAQDRETFRKQMLDWTTPEFRAMRDQYRQDLRMRMQQQGYTGGFGKGR